MQPTMRAWMLASLVCQALPLAAQPAGSPVTPPAPQAAPVPGAAASATARTVTRTTPLATVAGRVVTIEEYQRALAVATRKKYYHAKPPEAEYAAFQRKVADDVVNRVLLLDEARRRAIEPDREKIKVTVAGYDAQYGGSANWKTNREKMLANVVPQLEDDSRLQRLADVVKKIPEPNEVQARAYFEQNKTLFVEPEQVKLAVILLKVDPSSPKAVWAAAQAEGKELHRKLLAGAEFGELARLHSGDRSAGRGGEMEYTHRGMLPEAVQGLVDKLKPGDLSAPVQLLEGVAIVRLDGRRTAQQRSYEQVRERAGDLWQRAEAEARWTNLIAELRRAAAIKVDETLLAPLPAAPDKPRAG